MLTNVRLVRDRELVLLRYSENLVRTERMLRSVDYFPAPMEVLEDLAGIEGPIARQLLKIECQSPGPSSGSSGTAEDVGLPYCRVLLPSRIVDGMVGINTMFLRGERSLFCRHAQRLDFVTFRQRHCSLCFANSLSRPRISMTKPRWFVPRVTKDCQ